MSLPANDSSTRAHSSLSLPFPAVAHELHMVTVKVFLKTHCYAIATAFMQKKKKTFFFFLTYASSRI